MKYHIFHFCICQFHSFLCKTFSSFWLEPKRASKITARPSQKRLPSHAELEKSGSSRAKTSWLVARSNPNCTILVILYRFTTTIGEDCTRLNHFRKAILSIRVPIDVRISTIFFKKYCTYKFKNSVSKTVKINI